MPSAAFAEDLATYGPLAPAGQPMTADASRAYCRRLASTHYENFTVASWLLGGGLRQHFYNVYAWCRWSDDLADETSGPAESLALLDWWQGELEACYAGRGNHPVYVALGESIRKFDLPREMFLDLLSAFRQDQSVTRYQSFEELLDYCRRSANPVGRLVLCLGRCHDRERGGLADSICTGLQLVNFCQDVAGDWARGRIYLPQDECRAFNVDESSFAQHQASGPFKRLLAHQVDRAEDYLSRGLPLAAAVPRRLSAEVWLFAQGGLAIARSIRAVDYDVWNRRPELSTLDRIRLFAGCLRRKLPIGSAKA